MTNDDGRAMNETIYALILIFSTFFYLQTQISDKMHLS